ncbi:MAG: HEAT repeat domain-containing protein [Planctomycetota bacterium]|nr:HEAT repeat domain-containing protein [Planctomycetota bacterium]
MVQFTLHTRTVHVNIAYYGPDKAGKSSNLRVLHALIPKSQRDDYVIEASDNGHIVYFDYFPEDLTQLSSIRIGLRLSMIPNSVNNQASDRLLLEGADGIIFIADSQTEKMDDNIDSILRLRDCLASLNLDYQSLPIVFQWNKRDLPNIQSTTELQQQLNSSQKPSFEAVASTGEGVFPALKMLTQLLIKKYVYPFEGEELISKSNAHSFLPRSILEEKYLALDARKESLSERYELRAYPKERDLIEALSDPCPWTRRWAVLSIGRSPALLKKALPQLTHALCFDDEWVREAAAQSLGRAKHSPIVGDSLLGALSDPSHAVALAALRSLARLKQKGLPYLMRGLGAHHPLPLRIRTAEHLASLGLLAHESRGALFRIARESHEPRLVMACEEALAATKWSSKHFLAQWLDRVFPFLARPKQRGVFVNLLI